MLALILAALSLTAPSDETFLPLEFAQASVDGDRNLKLDIMQSVPVMITRVVQVQREIIEKVDGKDVPRKVMETETRTETVYNAEVHTHEFTADRYRVWRDGQPVDEATIASLLKSERDVACCAMLVLGGSAPKAATLLAPGTLVVAYEDAGPQDANATVADATSPEPAPAAEPEEAPMPEEPVEATPAPAEDEGPPTELAPTEASPVVEYQDTDGDQHIVQARLDEKGRLVLRERVGVTGEVEAFQVINLQHRGNTSRSIVRCDMVDVTLQRTLDLKEVIALDHQGQKSDAAKLASSIKQAWIPVVVWYQAPGALLSDLTPPNVDAVVKCVNKDAVLLMVPYPLIGAENTQVLDTSTAYSPAPSFGETRLGSDSQGWVVSSFVTMVPVSVQKEYQYRDRDTSQTKTETVECLDWSPTYETFMWGASDGQFFDASGASVPQEKAAKALAQGTPVLVSGDSKPMSAFYRKIVAQDTLVFVPDEDDSEPRVQVP